MRFSATGILEDRARRTSVTPRSPRRRPRRWSTRDRSAPRIPCRRPAAAGRRPREVNGRKRLIAVDVTCLLLAAIGRARVRQWLLLAPGE